MNFYQSKHGPSAADYLKELKEREKRLTPEQKRTMAEGRERDRMLNAGANVEVDRSDEEAEKLRHFLHDHRKIVKDDPEAKKLCWRGYADEIATRVTDLIPQFAKRMVYVRAQVKAHIECKAEEAQQRVESELNNQAYRKETIERVERELTDAKHEQTLQADLKRKPARQYSEAEKAKLIDCQAYSLKDLQRSRDNVTEKKTQLLKQIRDCEKAITQLETERKPFDEKAAELREKLDHDE